MLTDDEFVAMVDRAHGLRAEVAKLGFRSSKVDANVRARLYWNPKVPTLAVGHEALANEVYSLLTDWRLSQPQMAELEREYFPPRAGTRMTRDQALCGRVCSRYALGGSSPGASRLDEDK